MTTAKRTLGSWSVHRGLTQMCFAGTTVAEVKIRGAEDSFWIGSDADDHGDDKTDAYLLAAAPALLAACELAVNLLDSDGKNSGSSIVIAMRAAIAQAQGPLTPTVGDTVAVYHDPFTQTDLEGDAIVVGEPDDMRMEDNEGRPLFYGTVKFIDDQSHHGIYERQYSKVVA